VVVPKRSGFRLEPERRIAVLRFGRVALWAPPATLLVIAGLLATNVAPVPLFGATPADVPKLSTFAPIDELNAEADAVIEDLDKAVADEAGFKRGKVAAKRDANTLVIIAHAISQHDKKDDVKWAKNAASVRDAAKALAGAETFADARAALDRIKDLVAGGTPSDAAQPAEWNQLVPLPDLMPILNRRYLLMRRDLIRGKPRKRDATVRHAMLIALFGRTIRDDFSDVENAQDSEMWQTYADHLRDELTQLAKIVRDKKDDDIKGALKSTADACTTCHKKFRPDVE
jgi:hypothetical protein